MTPPIEALWSRFPGAGQWFGPTAPQWAGRGRAIVTHQLMDPWVQQGWRGSWGCRGGART
eukprot:COSAG01_NODE_14325_length_1467_cov_412.464912_1_plen_60_part_10